MTECCQTSGKVIAPAAAALETFAGQAGQSSVRVLGLQSVGLGDLANGEWGLQAWYPLGGSNFIITERSLGMSGFPKCWIPSTEGYRRSLLSPFLTGKLVKVRRFTGQAVPKLKRLPSQKQPCKSYRILFVWGLG